MTSVPTGKCGPCCSVAASGSTAIHRSAAEGETSVLTMSVQSRGGGVAVIDRNVSFGQFCGVCFPSKGRTTSDIPIMGQKDRRSPIMNPAHLLRALTLALVAFVAAIAPAAAQALEKDSFGTNSVHETEHT